MMSNHFKKMKKEQDDLAADGMMIDGATTSDVTIPKVLKLPRSGGVVSRPSNFIRQCRSRAVKRYFYGGMASSSNKSKDDNKDLSMGGTSSSSSSIPSIKSVVTHMAPQLTPHLKQISLMTNPTEDGQDDKIKVYKLSTMALSSSLLPVAQQQTTDAIQLEEVDVDAATSTAAADATNVIGSDGSDKDSDSLQHALVAVCHPSAVAAYQSSGRGRDLVTAGVAGFGAVESVVSGQSIDMLSPCAGSLPSKTFILGDITWME